MPQPKHNWRVCKDQKDRVILCLLKRSYERKFIAPLFSHVFEKPLSREGFRHGLDIDALDTQYQNMKRGGKGHEIFAAIHHATTQQIESRYSAQLQEIKAAIESRRLGVTFSTAKLKTSRIPSRTNQNRRQRIASIAVTSDSDPDITQNPTTRPRLQQFAYSSSSGNSDSGQAAVGITSVPPTLFSTFDHDSNEVEKHPVLLFRASTSATCFHARKVKGDRALSPPPSFGSPGFWHIARPHLQRDQSFPSPFVSFAQNPKNAIRRIELRMSAEIDQKMFLAVFLFNDLRQSGLDDYEDGSGPYLVRSLFKPGELSDLPDGYKGTGEWLKYGSINCKPIAILDGCQAIKLAVNLRRFKAGDVDALINVSRSMSSIPVQWRENIAYNVFGRYCGRRNLPAVGSHPYKLLMDVVHKGTEESLAKIKRFFVRSSTEEIEDKWTTQELRRVNDDDSDDDYDDQLFTLSPGQQQTESTVSQNRAIDTVAYLNALASSTSKSDPKTRDTQHSRTRPSPLWSPDSDTDIQYHDNEGILHNQRRQLTLEEIPRIPLPTPRTPYSSSTQKQEEEEEVIQSIETDHNFDAFRAELIASSTQAMSPFQTPVRTPRRTLFKELTQSRSETIFTPRATASSPAKPPRDLSAIKPAFSTPHSKPFRSKHCTSGMQKDKLRDKFKSKDKDTDDNDDDFVIIGSGYRDHVNIPFRSLSVHDSPATASVVPRATAREVLMIDSEDEFMSAEEVF